MFSIGKYLLIFGWCRIWDGNPSREAFILTFFFVFFFKVLVPLGDDDHYEDLYLSLTFIFFSF